MKILPRMCLSVLITLGLVGANRAAAQAPGYADISFPAEGEAVSGVVTIMGSASHPFFSEYDLAFSYQDDPSDTWFNIAEDVKSEVQSGAVGIWDTSGITDGTYRIRLRVHLAGRETLVAFVDNIRLRNYTQVETATPGAARTESTLTPVLPTSTPRPTPLPARVGDGGQTVARAFTFGAAAAILGLLGGAFYLFAHERMRIRMGILRTRRMLRQEDRKQRKQN